MINIPKKSPNSFVIGLISILSMLFLITPPFERNVQQCEMIREIGRKKKSGFLQDDETE
ncbi:hypothetical protein [Pedobacter psychrodurus]|uniref:hypothetical protein n=1 Tax=Pedobacter psychrodurus TaxID=2530456 RepID=UPI002931E7FD|nr:hypothetical protein [Pedobacter psychrodurus]